MTIHVEKGTDNVVDATRFEGRDNADDLVKWIKTHAKDGLVNAAYVPAGNIYEVKNEDGTTRSISGLREAIVLEYPHRFEWVELGHYVTVDTDNKIGLFNPDQFEDVFEEIKDKPTVVKPVAPKEDRR